MSRSALLGLLLLAAAPARGQVLVAPTFVAVDAAEPIGTFTVINQSEAVQEVEVGFRFGYSVSDSTGDWRVHYEEGGPVAEAHAADPWLRSFPRRFVLEPGARQAVRVMAQPPAGLADGAYWSRLSVRSQEQAELTAEPTDAISANVNLVFEQTVPLVVHRGASATGLRAGAGAAHVEGDLVRLMVPLTREGASPFFGTLGIRVLDAAGAQVHAFERGASVYFDFVERIDFDAAGWAPGAYRALVTFRAGRDNVPADLLPAMAPVTTEVAFSIQ